MSEMAEDTTDPDSPQMADEIGASNGDSDTDCALGDLIAHEVVESDFDLASYDPDLVAQSIFDSIPLSDPLPKYTQESIEHGTPPKECESGNIIYPVFAGYQASFADTTTSQLVVSPSLGNGSPLARGPPSPILPRAVQARGGKRKFVADPDVEQGSPGKRVKNAARSDFDKNRMMHSIDDAGISKRHSRARGQKHPPVPRPSGGCPCPTFVRGSDLHTLFPIPDGHHLEMNQLMCCIRGFTSFVRLIGAVPQLNDFVSRPENRYMYPCIQQMEECMARSFDPPSQ